MIILTPIPSSLWLTLVPEAIAIGQARFEIGARRRSCRHIFISKSALSQKHRVRSNDTGEIYGRLKSRALRCSVLMEPPKPY